MSARLVANANGHILYHQGDIDQSYGIASLSKVWAAILIHKQAASTLFQEPIVATVDYAPLVYSRMAPRPDLQPPDNPLTYQPFRKEKAAFCLPIKKDNRYSSKELFEAALFESKNDAAQALADHVFANDDNRSFRTASYAMAQALGLSHTKIGDAHGLCDGDNVSTARELMKFCVALIREGHMPFFNAFSLAGKNHTAQPLFQDERLTQKGIKILLAKTATGNNRHGNDWAQSLLVIARQGEQMKIAITLTDADKFKTISDMLLIG